MALARALQLASAVRRRCERRPDIHAAFGVLHVVVIEVREVLQAS